MADDNQENHNVKAAMKLQIEQLLQYNKALQACMTKIQQQHHERDEIHQEKVDGPDTQPLSVDI